MVADYEPLARSLGSDRSLERFTFLGSGAYYGLAAEAMLKMKEMSLTPWEAFHVLEFRHGPKSVISHGACVVGLISDRAAAEELKVLAEMRKLGATTIAVVESAAELPRRVADEVVELRSGVSALARSALLLPFLVA